MQNNNPNGNGQNPPSPYGTGATQSAPNTQAGYPASYPSSPQPQGYGSQPQYPGAQQYPQGAPYPAQGAAGQVTFASIVAKSTSILIVLPTDPSFDQVAAGLSLFMSLSKQKAVQIYCPSPMTVEFNRLIGVNKIVQEMGNKNMIIKFVNYNASDIERVSYDIDAGQFKLTVIPKENVNPPGKDQVNFGYAGVSVDTVVLIGGANEASFPVVGSQELGGANVVRVGLRQVSFSASKNYISFTRIGSSVSEIVYGLIRENQLFIDPDISTNLLMGVENIVGSGFKGEGTTAETFYTYADLMQYGAKRNANQPDALGNYPQGSIPGQVPKWGTQLGNQPAGQPMNQMGQPMSQMQVGQPLQQVNQTAIPTSVQEQVDQKQDEKKAEEGVIDEDSAPEDWKKPKVMKVGTK